MLGMCRAIVKKQLHQQASYTDCCYSVTERTKKFHKYFALTNNFLVDRGPNLLKNIRKPVYSAVLALNQCRFSIIAIRDDRKNIRFREKSAKPPLVNSRLQKQ